MTDSIRRVMTDAILAKRSALPRKVGILSAGR